MKKVILTKGLPGSGKTTWAKQFMAERTTDYGEKWKRVNKDELRAMIDNGQWSRDNEQFVLKVRNFVVEQALENGYSVIVDDTNLHSKHKNEMWKIAAAHKATVEEKSFLDVSVFECIRRDLIRPNSVGQKVILDMHKQFLMPEPEKAPFDPKLPMCIICDIDGTLAHMKDRGPFDWHKVGSDDPNPTIMGILKTYHDHDAENPEWEPTKIILFSGRDSVCRKETEAWLENFGVEYHELHMRAEGDMRKDSIVKRELYDAHVKGKYNVLFVLDDRNQVVDMWRQMGLTCLQVAPGDF